MNWWQKKLYRLGVIDSECKFAGLHIKSARLFKFLVRFSPLVDFVLGQKVKTIPQPPIIQAWIPKVVWNKDSIARDRVEYWMTKIKEGVKPPPILLTHDNVIIDGHARCAAKERLGFKTIDAVKYNREIGEYMMAGGVVRHLATKNI